MIHGILTVLLPSVNYVKTYVTISDIPLGNSDTRNRDTIDLTGDIWEDDLDNDDDDDWYLDYNFLEDKPKQSKPHGSNEPLDHALHEQFLDINSNLAPKPASISCQNKTQNRPSSISNSTQLKLNAVNKYPKNQPQVGPSSSYDPMTNAKCISFHTPDPTQYKSSSFLSKQTVENHVSSSTKPPKPSLYKPNQYKSSNSRLSNDPRPSTNIRPSHSPLNRSNFTWSTNQGSPKPSGTKPLSAKTRLHGDFVTAADVAKAGRKRENEMSCQGTSIYKNAFSSNGLGIVNQSSSNYSGPKKESYALKYKPAAQKPPSVLQSQYFSSDVYPRERNKTNTHNQSSPEYEISPEYGIYTRSSTQSLTSVEDTAVTRAFHKPNYGNILQETSTNIEQHKESKTLCVEADGAQNTWGNPVVLKRCVGFEKNCYMSL